jgi:HEAT repeat protein
MNAIQNLLAALVDGDDVRAEAAALQIASLGPEVIPDLSALLSDLTTETRWWAVRTLAEIPHPNVVPQLVQALRDSDLSVRQCAALALRQHPDPRAIDELSSVMRDNDILLARLAGNALVALGAAAVPDLLDVMQKKNQPSCLEAVRALALIGDTRAIPTLYSALDSDSVIIEYWATEGLERMGVGMAFYVP